MALSPALFRRIEAMNVRGRQRTWAYIPPALARRTQSRVIRIADGVATLMKRSDSLRVNRVIGLGNRGEATAGTIDRLIAIYREHRIPRFSLEVAPGPQAEALDRWLAARGFSRGHGYSVLAR